MITETIHGMPSNDHTFSYLMKSLFGIPNSGHELRPRCFLCGKYRSGSRRRSGFSAFICSRPTCEQSLKTMVLPNELRENQITLEVHHYMHGNASVCKAEPPSDVAELSDEMDRKLAEMPDNKPGRVTRSRTRRQLNVSHDGTPPLVRVSTKPTLQP